MPRVLALTMQNMSYILEVPRFIREVKKYPYLWDSSHQDSKDKLKKENAWAAIAKVFIPEFDEMSGAEKNDVYRKLYGKWRNIRDAYVRHSKRKDGKEYLYAKLLTFLAPTLREPVCITGDQSEDTEQQWSDEDTKVQEFAYNTWITDEDPSTSSADNLKRKRPTDVLEYVDTSLFTDANKAYLEDDDKSFFESLLPAVRSLDLDQKLEFRCGVLNLIKTLRKTGQLKNGAGDFEE